MGVIANTRWQRHDCHTNVSLSVKMGPKNNIDHDCLKWVPITFARHFCTKRISNPFVGKFWSKIFPIHFFVICGKNWTQFMFFLVTGG